MRKKISKTKKAQYDRVLAKGMDKEFKNKKSKLTKENRRELKAFAIQKAVKIKKYVRN